MAEQDKEKAKQAPAYDPSILPDMLPVYYKRLFPHDPFYRWLAYGLSEDGIFANREISFTLHDDIYVRYLCFESQEEMEKEICSRNPYKIDIGAVMSTRPKNFRIVPGGVKPVQREVSIDIDLTDYDPVRTCCSGAEVCTKCWKFMVVAAQILDAALRDDFGFEHVIWVFSGRRGIHGWVCDATARHLDGRGRAAVADYLNVLNYVQSVDGTTTRVQLGDRIHHSLQRALTFIRTHFDKIVLEEQNVFGTPKGVKKLVDMISDETAANELRDYLQKTHEDGAPSRVVWESFVRFANSMRTASANVWSRKLKHVVEEVQLGLLYPRLDINVTKGFNHLLKAPFCIHPGTGKLCVPFSVSTVEKFDPTTVPTITQLLEEINVFDDKTKSYMEAPEDKSRIKDYKKSSMMFKGVRVFEEFIRKMERDYKNQNTLNF